jgi:nitrite reductase (NADH) small subunit
MTLEVRTQRSPKPARTPNVMGAGSAGAARLAASKSAAVAAGSAGRWVRVCGLDDIVPGAGVCALVGNRQVAVFRLADDSLHAIGNHDPLSGANVLSRGIVGDQGGEIVVASPIYKQHFSLVSGRCLEEPDASVPVFAVRLEGSAVMVLEPGAD